MKNFLVFFILLATSTNLYGSSLTISPTSFRFDYRELDSSGNQLNKEEGYLYGLSLNANFDISSKWELTLEGRLLKGDVDYDGQTQLGSPLSTTTEERLEQLELRIAYRVIPNLQLFLGYGKNYWERDIQPSGNVLGLYEEYRWQQISLGFAQHWRFGHQHWHYELAALAIRSPEIDIDLSTLGVGTVNLPLGNDYGARASIGWQTQYRQVTWGFTGTFEYWGFEASEDVRVSNGTNLLTIREPKSESRHFSIAFNLAIPFE